MKTIAVIPARMNSTRFPDKPLKKICGVPMIGHCYYRTALAVGKKNTYVATCDDEIFDYITSIGGYAIMTGSHHTRATTRTAEALEIIEKKLTQKIEIVLMIQGDEPLVDPITIKKMADEFDNNEEVEIVNIMSPIDTIEIFNDVNNVKVVVDNNSNAIYFSREPIPSAWQGFDDSPRYMQTGIIGFRRNSLISFNSVDETFLEKIESVDMNRVLETGNNIRMVLSESKTIGVDVPEDLHYVESVMSNNSIFKQYK